MFITLVIQLLSKLQSQVRQKVKEELFTFLSFQASEINYLPATWQQLKLAIHLLGQHFLSSRMWQILENSLYIGLKPVATEQASKLSDSVIEDLKEVFIIAAARIQIQCPITLKINQILLVLRTINGNLYQSVDPWKERIQFSFFFQFLLQLFDENTTFKLILTTLIEV